MLGQCLHLSPQGKRIDGHMLFCLCLRSTVVASYSVCTDSKFSEKVELGSRSSLAMPACYLTSSCQAKLSIIVYGFSVQFVSLAQQPLVGWPICMFPQKFCDVIKSADDQLRPASRDTYLFCCIFRHGCKLLRLKTLAVVMIVAFPYKASRRKQRGISKHPVQANDGRKTTRIDD